MVRVFAGVGVLIGAFTLSWGVLWLKDPPESFGYPYGVGLVIFGLVALFAGLSVLRSGRI